MKSFSYIIQDPAGVHARPAAALVLEAKKFSSQLQIESNNKKADLKGILGLMALGIKIGMKITVTATGEDEVTAIKAMEVCIKEKL